MQETSNSRNEKCLPSSIKDECFYAWALTVKQAPLMYYGLQLNGKLNHEIMESALVASLEIHPKLRCVLTREGSSWKQWFRFVWEPRDVATADILKFLNASEHGIEIDRGAHYYRDLILKHSMDISREPGIRILLLSKDEESLLIIGIHHAAADARGGLNWIETFISEYNAIYFNRKTVNENAGTDAYPAKSLWMHAKGVLKSFLYMLQHQYRALREPLIKISPKAQAPDDKGVLVVARKLERAELEAIITMAKKKSIRFADLLLAATYLAIRTWNSRCGDDASGRISFFASVGVLQGDPKSVGNITAGMIIDFLTKENIDKNHVLSTIAKAREDFLAYGDIYGFLSFFTLMPVPLRLRALKRVLKRMRTEQNRRFPTMRVANLGMLQTTNFSQNKGALVGEATLQKIILSPANINEVPWLLFHTHEKNLYVYLATLPSAFSRESAEEFLALFVQELLAF